MILTRLALALLCVQLVACAAQNKSPGTARLPSVPTPADARAVSPAFAKSTASLLIDEVWKRPGLSPRDRSLITVSALVANGQVGQVGFHLNRAMDNGLTQPQASEMLTQLAFYAGWPNVFSAVPAFKSVFASRAG